MAVVYVVQEVENRNLTPAASFGTVVTLLPPGQVSFSAGAVVHQLRQRLQKFTDKDYLLLIGDPVAIGLACAVAAQANNGRINLLKWDRQQYKYFPLSVDTYGRVDN